MMAGTRSTRPLFPEECARPFLIAGPCVLEDEEMAIQVAAEAAAAARECGIFYIFKASYRKDNRTAPDSPSGPGLSAGLRILERVRREIDVPVMTDLHCREEVAAVAEVVDLLQIPAFLCRQSRLIAACGATGRAINIKKGQFVAPADMAHAVAKVRAVNPAAEILLTERGTCFGYRDLVIDMRSIAHLRSFGCRVVFDATHALQHPGAGGDRRFVMPLARAALAAGAEGIFAEVHPQPERALSDATTQLPLDRLPRLLDEWRRLGELIASIEETSPSFAGSDWPGLEERRVGSGGN